MKKLSKLFNRNSLTNQLKSILTIFLLTAVSVGCGSSLKIDSHWRDRDLAIDGMHEDWQDAMTFIENENVAIEIIGPGKGQHRVMRVAEAEGIEIRVNPSVDQFAYEIKIPLSQSENQPYAIGAEAGQSIGVGFETAVFDREMMREGMGGGRSGGRGGTRPGGGIGGGMSGGRGGGRMGGGRPQMPKQFKLWVSVQLLAENASVEK